MMQSKPTVWLRAEHKALEERSAITPDVAKQLIQAGYQVVVEQSAQRAIPMESFVHVGCETAAEHSWQSAPHDVIVVGLKELEPELGPFVHRHIHFAHVYKYQQGWQAMLKQFELGGGTLYDLEYLVDEHNRRVAAFGYWAGYVGAALGVLTWAAQQRSQSLGELSAWSDRTALFASVQVALEACDTRPTSLLIGALGRSGQGAAELLKACNVPVLEWDIEQTRRGGPFDEVLQHDLLVNCVFLKKAIAPFTTTEHLQSSQRRLTAIVDVSCDPFSDANPLPVYNQCTSLQQPVLRLIEQSADQRMLDIISIDHLPSLLPVESSEDFAAQLAPYLLTLDQLDSGVWQRAHTQFVERSAEARTGVNS